MNTIVFECEGATTNYTPGSVSDLNPKWENEVANQWCANDEQFHDPFPLFSFRLSQVFCGLTLLFFFFVALNDSADVAMLCSWAALVL